ncbi:MAG: BlaI/MecI/CopY family transcriptional regulator [Candidatus Korarchaeota archaeon]|nr:BlaI/MecI/CopY family transcriptional regulator [Thermoproteota archaeon]
MYQSDLDDVSKAILKAIQESGELGFNELCRILKKNASRNTIRKRLSELVEKGYVEEKKGRKGQRTILKATATLKAMKSFTSKINHLYTLVERLVKEKREFWELFNIKNDVDLAFEMLEFEVLKANLPRGAKKDLLFDLIESREKARKLISSNLVELKTTEIEKAEKELLEAAKRSGLYIRHAYEEVVKQLENLLREGSLTIDDEHTTKKGHERLAIP